MVIFGGVGRDLAVDTRRDEYGDMLWKVDMLFQACIQGRKEAKRLSTGEGCILALLLQDETTLYTDFDSVFLTARYGSRMVGQRW
jgi:hypothetical protein